MDPIVDQYQFWIEKLGWVTQDMLCVLTRGVPRAHLPDGRDRRLERFLADAAHDGELTVQSIGRHRVYGLPKGQGRAANVYHDLMAAQVAVKLWFVFRGVAKTLFNPRDFFTQSSPVVPDFGLSLNLSNGIHVFALEYQTYKEASRTTESKLLEYWKNFAQIKDLLRGDFLWVIFVLERDELWIEEFASTVSENFAYLVSATTFFKTEAIETEPVFFVAKGNRVSLVEKV